MRTVAVASFVYVGWYQSSDFIDVLVASAIWAVAAVGLGLVLGGAGQMWLCQASFVLAGAYVYGWLAGERGVPTPIALVGALVVGAALAVLIAPVLRARGYALALASIALGLLIERLFSTGDWLPGGSSGIGGIPPLRFGSIELATSGGYLVFTTLLLALVVALLHWRFGVGSCRRAIQAIHDDEELLAAMGGDAVALKRGLLATAGAFGGLAGGLYASAFGFVHLDGFRITESFALALAVLVGGSGRLLGAVLGALVYQLAFVVLGADASDYRFALLGLIVITTVYGFPGGLLPTRADVAPWLRAPSRNGGRAPATAPPRPVEPLAVSLDGVTKSYGALDAVKDLTLEVRPGALMALVGPNGAGKTTVLDLIAGEQALTDGRVRFGSVDVTDALAVERARLGASRTFQRLRLVGGLDVLGNVLLGADLDAARNSRLSEGPRQASARAALAEVGLSGFEDAPIASLSFGQRRLVEMARALASRPRLLLLDEPSSGLASTEVDEMAEIVQRLHARGATVLLVEHNLPFVRSLAHEVTALDGGRLLAHGPTGEVFASSAFRRAYLGAAA